MGIVKPSASLSVHLSITCPRLLPKKRNVPKTWVTGLVKACSSVFHIQPGGLWSGDYLVVDWEPLQNNPNATPGQSRIHRTSDVSWDPSVCEFALSECRKLEERMVKLPAPPVTVQQAARPEAERAPVGQLDPPVDGGGGASQEAPPVPSGLSWVDVFGAGPQDDMRGKGDVLPDGRVVRPYNGSKRPPGIDPDVWARLFTTRERQLLINDYESYI